MILLSLYTTLGRTHIRFCRRPPPRVVFEGNEFANQKVCKLQILTLKKFYTYPHIALACNFLLAN